MEFLESLREGPSGGAQGVQIVKDDGQLVVWSGQAETVFHTRRRVITRGEHVIAKFSDVQAVDIRVVRDRDRPKTWSVSLRTSFIGSIDITVTTDDAEASILGARLSEALGVPVVA
jgi:hypothetical protein